MRKLFISFCILPTLLVSNTLFAQVVNLATGESKKIAVKEKIDTIFITNPAIANYKILSDKSLLLYGLQEGKTDINVLGTDDKNLFNATLAVGAVNEIAMPNGIKIKLPNSQLRVDKIGQAYVIEGRAKNQAELDKVKRLVAAATGSPINRENGYKIGNGEDVLIDDLGKELLTKYTYDNVLNHAKVDETTQINVRLTLVEVNRKLADYLGISWSNLRHDFFGATIKASGGFNGNTGISKLDFTAGSLSGFISALNNSNYAKTLAEPSLSMLSGEQASVLIGGEIPYPETDKDGNRTITYKTYGIRLDVGARIQENGRIRIALSQSNSQPDNNPNDPELKNGVELKKTGSSSSFEVANGESFIIAGLYNKRHNEGLTKVPFLGDLPIVGSLFRSTGTDEEEKEVVIIATVNLVKAVNETDIVLPNFEETGTLERFFNLTSLKKGYEYTQVTNFLQRGGFIQ